MNFSPKLNVFLLLVSLRKLWNFLVIHTATKLRGVNRKTIFFLTSKKVFLCVRALAKWNFKVRKLQTILGVFVCTSSTCWSLRAVTVRYTNFSFMSPLLFTVLLSASTSLLWSPQALKWKWTWFLLFSFILYGMRLSNEQRVRIYCLDYTNVICSAKTIKVYMRQRERAESDENNKWYRWELRTLTRALTAIC